MKFQPERILKDDLARAGEVPAWIDTLLGVLNNFIDSLGSGLQRGLSFSDNFYGTEITLTMTHGIAYKYSLPSGKSCKGIAVVDASNQIVSGYGFTRNSDGSISITVNFAAGGSTSAACLIQIQYR
jgi:hypothetical protein